MSDDLLIGIWLLVMLAGCWMLAPLAVHLLAWLDRRAQRGTDTIEDALREWTR